MKKAVIILFLISLFGNQIVFAQRAINKVTFDFYTTTDDKDHDTGVEIWFKGNDNSSVIAHAIINQGDNTYYDNNTDNYLDAQSSGYTEDQLQGGHVDIKINPNGHDTWHFDLYITVYYTNGETSEFRSIGWNLSQDNTTDSKVYEPGHR